ncbi:MAG TPA: endolytic transglycosylase MltG, partial [Candidatus Paceibacterota bacterium]
YYYFSHFAFGREAHPEPGGYKLSSAMRIRDMVYALEEKPWAKYVTISPDTTKEQMGEIIGEALGWGTLDRQYFAHTYAGMQWQNYEEILEEIFEKQYAWDKTEKEAFLTLSALYYDSQHDFLKKMYVPGTYEIPIDSSRAQVAGLLMEQFDKQYKDKKGALDSSLDKSTMDNIAKLIENEMVLMPDIVAIPPQDVTLKNVDGRTNLLFTASYWNKGRGALEFVADQSTREVEGDVERKVNQRIYHLDGDYEEHLSGVFLWHKEHRHYHFKDFAIYTLEPVENIEGSNFPEKLSFKSTFCVRDSEPTDLSHPGADRNASYKVCGKERQGISPGWADSYYYTYIDQKFDITNIPKGVYKLKITINPENRFEEITKENNIGEALL